jgi:STE24 endopeptidase
LNREISVFQNLFDKAKDYQGIRLRLSILNTGLELAVLWILLSSGLSRTLSQWADSLTRSAILQVFLYFIVLGLAGELLTLPLDYIRGFHIEHRFGMSNQTRKAWFGDWVKSLLAGGVIGLGLAQLVYALLRTAGDHWWWIAASLTVLLMVLLAQAAPVVLLPLFYKYKPLDRPELKARLLALAEKCGARVVDVFELQLSAKSKAANAALAGLGRTRRILLGDTLLNRYTEDEIEAVLAHELGHHVHSHLWKNIGAQTGIVFLGFFLAGRFLGWGVSAYGFEDHADLAAFPLLAVTFAVLAVVLLPAVNSLSRQYEREADRFAAEVTGRPEALASALERLAEQNLADREPNPVAEFLFYSHPSIGRRVRALGKDES